MTNSNPFLPASTADLPPATNGRSTEGKFLPGNKFGQGNPSLKRLHALKAKAQECATDEELVTLLKSLAKKGAEGDAACARLWLEYTLGKPSQAIELSSADVSDDQGDMEATLAVVLAALAPYPEARYAAGAAIYAMHRRNTDAPSSEEESNNSNGESH